MVGGFIGLVKDLFLGLRDVFHGVIESILGSVDELGQRILELLDGLVLGRNFLEEGFRGSVRLNGYLAHDLLVRNNEGSGESRKRQNMGELHDCCGEESILVAGGGRKKCRN